GVDDHPAGVGGGELQLGGVADLRDDGATVEVDGAGGGDAVGVVVAGRDGGTEQQAGATAAGDVGGEPCGHADGERQARRAAGGVHRDGLAVGDGEVQLVAGVVLAARRAGDVRHTRVLHVDGKGRRLGVAHDLVAGDVLGVADGDVHAGGRQHVGVGDGVGGGVGVIGERGFAERAGDE